MARTSTSSGEPLREFCREVLKKKRCFARAAGKPVWTGNTNLAGCPRASASVILLDKDAQFFEIGLWAAYKMYEQWGNIAAAGAVAGIGNIAGIPCMIIANDATVKAGAFFPQPPRS